MCGIIAIADNKNNIQSNDFEVYLNELYRRGPDSNGVWIDSSKGIGLAMSRLSIVDLTNGIQPMLNKEKTIALVFNGEIFNSPGLRKELELKGVKFSTTSSDTEVILKGYEFYGESICSKLNGMFSFVIYDKRKMQLFFARDIFGIKPLYYSELSNGIILGSTLNTILRNKEAKKASSLSLTSIIDLFLFDSIQQTSQIYKNINEVKPGTYQIYSVTKNRIIKSKQFSTLVMGSSELSHNEFLEELPIRLKNAVHRWTMSDVGYDLSLSGGLDSTIIASLLKDKNINAHTISYGFSDKEINVAKKTANLFSLNHSLYEVNENNFIEDHLEMLKAIEEPYFGGLPSFYIYQKLQGKTKVLLTGTGGDELFGNYDKINSRQNYFIREAFKIKKYFQTSLNVPYFPFNMDYAKTIKGLIQTESYKEIKDSIKSKKNLGYTEYDIINYATIRHQLSTEFLKVTDRFSSYHSIESRTPFLDKELAEFVLSMPFQFRESKKLKKETLIKAFQKKIPEEVKNLKKTGFIESNVRMKILENSEINLFLEKEFIKRQDIFSEAHIKKMSRNPDFLWRYYIFQIWFKYLKI